VWRDTRLESISPPPCMDALLYWVFYETIPTRTLILYDLLYTSLTCCELKNSSLNCTSWGIGLLAQPTRICNITLVSLQMTPWWIQSWADSCDLRLSDGHSDNGWTSRERTDIWRDRQMGGRSTSLCRCCGRLPWQHLLLKYLSEQPCLKSLRSRNAGLLGKDSGPSDLLMVFLVWRDTHRESHTSQLNCSHCVYSLYFLSRFLIVFVLLFVLQS
jgi:hypothetical protein